MASKRTTVQILPLLTWTNAQLARTDEAATRDFKAGCCVMIEKVLMNANRYNGFSFIEAGTRNSTDEQYYAREYSF